MPNVTLGPYNSITIAAASGVYRLKFVPPGFTRNIDLMNLGPGAIFIRGGTTDPAVNDANSLQVPANWAVNSVTVDGSVGLGVIAAADTTISVRYSS
jgi:hypothetical protein